MQGLIRNLPAVIFEYAFYPDGSGKFQYLSEECQALFGVEAGVLLSGASAIASILGVDCTVFKNDTDQHKPGQTRRTTITLNVAGISKVVSFTYSDELKGGGVILRRGIAQESQRPASSETSEDSPHGEGDLLQKLPIGVVIHHKGIILFANKHAHSLVGATNPRQLIGMNAMSFVPPEYHPGIHERIKQVSSGRAVPMVEEKFICLDGRVIDVETMAFPCVYEGKEAVELFFRDITEKKKAEALIRKSETLFKQLFENVPMAVVMLDGNGKVSEINRGFEQMFGYKKRELEGRNLNDFIVPDDLRSEGIDLNNLIASNRIISIETIRHHKSGKLINVILCGVPVIFDDEVIGIYGVYVDITDRKRVEEELKIRNAELDNFVYKVSHDLRAPLSSVLGLVNLSKLQGNTDNLIEYLELIGGKITALDNFISDVLSHSKNLKAEVSIGKVDLHQIIEQTFADLSYLKGARETRHSVTVEGVEFFSDPWRVSEIFRNLISNAIKYRKPDVLSEIIITIHVDHLCADITFADNGIGIDEASLKRIFEMFYRATEQGDGSGIGLYIVKNAVEKLGGQIKVTSRPNHGTRFNILLPNRINRIIDTSKI